MQKITFANGKIINAEEIRGSSYNGRETLIFTFPETETTFEELKEIFIDKEATEEITIEYEDADNSIKQNLQVGFIVPITLSYSNAVRDTGDKYTMTLGKRTQVEAEYAELSAKIAELAEKVEHLEQEIENFANR